MAKQCQNKRNPETTTLTNLNPLVKTLVDKVQNIQNTVTKLKAKIERLSNEKKQSKDMFSAKIFKICKQREYEIQRYYIDRTKFYCDDIVEKNNRKLIDLVNKVKALKYQNEDLEIKYKFCKKNLNKG